MVVLGGKRRWFAGPQAVLRRFHRRIPDFHGKILVPKFCKQSTARAKPGIPAPMIVKRFFTTVLLLSRPCGGGLAGFLYANQDKSGKAFFIAFFDQPLKPVTLSTLRRNKRPRLSGGRR